MTRSKKVMTLGGLILVISEAAKGNKDIVYGTLGRLCQHSGLRVTMRNVRDRRVVVTL
ncbi:MAG: hypothetical protein WCO48_01850 [Candidatus Taylorbacteria bacterium]